MIDQWDKADTCTRVAWGISALFGILVAVIAYASIGIWLLVAIVIGIAAGIGAGWLLPRLLCPGESRPGVTPSAPLPEAAKAPPPGPAAAVEPGAKAADVSLRGEPSTAAAQAQDAAGRKPALLSEPRGGKGDDLKKIKGVGPALEKELNAKGVWHFDQIAAWTPEEVTWADENLVRFKGRVSRDDWVGQAKLLAAGGETEFSKKVDKGDVY